MQRMKHTLRASTLAETLVMMLIAGIVFLAAMEALTTLARLSTQRTAMLLEAERQREAISCLGHLLTTADSIRTYPAIPGGSDHMLLYRAGQQSELIVCRAALLLIAGTFRDTLMNDICRMRLMRYPTHADTVEIITDRQRMLRMPVRRHARERYETTIHRIENGYGYDDEDEQ